MKRLLSIFLLVLLLLSGCRPDGSHKPLMGGIRPSKEALELSDSTAFFLPAALTDRPEQLLWRTGYVASYNHELKIPNWVAWQLTAEHCQGTVKRQSATYHEDTDVPSPRAQDSDYYGSGYDRGHMCPAGDNKWNQQAMADCFLFTNMCPQSHTLNSGDWNSLEMRCRTWAQRFEAIQIVCGPVFYGQPTRTIGAHRVAVPDAFFKVIVCLDDHPRGIGFVFDNNDSSQKMRTRAVSIDHVEQLTGIDFFATLPQPLQQTVESMNDFDNF